MRQADVRASIDARLEDLFGAGIDWAREAGVVHVAALDERSRAVLAVGPSAPSSATDRFMLGFARARADVIVTTGAILRAEPALVHRYADDPDEERAWQAWRRSVLDRGAAPRLLVLSASGRIPTGHPALRGPDRPILWPRETQGSGYAESGLEARAAGPAREVGAVAAGAAASLARAIAWLRTALGAETIAIEAGPAATLGLYRGGDASAPIDELLLGLFAGAGADLVAGEAFPSTARLAAYFGGSRAAAQPRSRIHVEEPSGGWTFERYRRARVRDD